jgi:hypothetical protein
MKTWQKVAIGCGSATLIVVGGCVGLGVFFAQKVLNPPDWYGKIEPSATPAAAGSATQLVNRIAKEVQAAPPGPLSVTITEGELQSFFNEALETQLQGNPELRQGIRNVRVDVHDDRVRMGATLDIKKIKAGLARNGDPGSQAALGQLNSVLTPDLERAIGDRNFFVGIDGKLEVKNGKLYVSPDSDVLINSFSQKFGDVVGANGGNRTGELTDLAPLGTWQIDKVSTGNNALVLSGNKGSGTPPQR